MAHPSREDDMNLLPSSYVEQSDTGNKRIDTLVDVYVHPTIAEFRQIVIHYETGTPYSPTGIRFTYQNWNKAYPVELHLNGGEIPLSSDLYSVDHQFGRIETSFGLEQGDNAMATYCFNYFPQHVLDGFVRRAIVTANTAGSGSITDYTVDTIPDSWLGIVADLTISMCMEKLILEYDLWKGRLVFAISNNGIYDGSDNIVSQLELVKRNSEERAYKSIDNPKLRAPNVLATPTDRYYEALLAGSSARYKNGSVSYGPLRGMKFNRLMGSVPRK